MPDRYLRLAASKPGRAVMRRLSLPVPVPLQRYHLGKPVVDGPVAVVAAPGGRLHDSTQRHLASNQPAAAIVLDATGIRNSAELVAIPTLLAPMLPNLAASGRVIVLGTPPTAAASVGEAVAQRALEGVTRSLGKELRAGATCNLLYVNPGAEDAIESTLRFLLSTRSASVSGQVVRVAAGAPTAAPDDWSHPLAGAVALVTGAARGIGEQVAAVLACDGADVLCLDVPAQAEALHAAAKVMRHGGSIALMSSFSAIAGNRGQTNYAASKAGLIGLVEALAPTLAAEHLRINAVAPGFIETQMTAHLPLAVREAGRRLNSLGQGGEPIDVAETVAWLAAPATAGVTRQVVRVCGQAMLGA